jgi:hypothetical protein
MSKYTKNPKKNYTFLSYELPSSLVDDEQPTYLTNLKKKKKKLYPRITSVMLAQVWTQYPISLIFIEFIVWKLLKINFSYLIIIGLKCIKSFP